MRVPVPLSVTVVMHVLPVERPDLDLEPDQSTPAW